MYDPCCGSCIRGVGKDGTVSMSRCDQGPVQRAKDLESGLADLDRPRVESVQVRVDSQLRPNPRHSDLAAATDFTKLVACTRVALTPRTSPDPNYLRLFHKATATLPNSTIASSLTVQREKKFYFSSSCRADDHDIYAGDGGRSHSPAVCRRRPRARIHRVRTRRCAPFISGDRPQKALIRLICPLLFIALRAVPFMLVLVLSASEHLRRRCGQDMATVALWEPVAAGRGWRTGRDCASRAWDHPL